MQYEATIVKSDKYGYRAYITAKGGSAADVLDSFYYCGSERIARAVKDLYPTATVRRAPKKVLDLLRYYGVAQANYEKR